MKNYILGIGMAILFCWAGAAHATTEWSAQDYDLYIGDFNGDGKTDILYIAKSPDMPSGIALSDGTGPNIAWQSWASNFLGITWSGNNYNVIVADFNGDGKADIFLQSKTPGNSSYLLLTSSAGFVVAAQPLADGELGANYLWNATQHHLVAGDFNGDGRADLFLQAVSSTGVDAVVLANTDGTLTTVNQYWTDGYLGFKWSTQSANVFAGNFNGNTAHQAGLLIQAKPIFVIIDYDVPFPVPTYPPNMNGFVAAQSASPLFTAAGAQAWSRMNNGVDWSPLTNTVIVGANGTGQSVVVMQARYTGQTSYELVGNVTGAIFPSSATALSSNVDLSADTYHLIAGNFAGGSGVGLYYQALTFAGTNYITDAVGATITASVQNPATVTGTVEPTTEGRTAGQFTVSPNGSAQYTIPLWAPPGPRGVQPRLSLAYDSQSGIGPLGVGWSIQGLSAISLCNSTFAQDSVARQVILTRNHLANPFCLDRKRLRLTSPSGQTPYTYQTEIADFSNVTATGSLAQAPTYFTVQAKNGLTYMYGYTDANGNGDNSVVNYQPGGAGTTAPAQWLLSKVIDRSGNNWVINYTALTGTAVPSTILWTATGASTYAYTITFNYSVGGNAPQSSIYNYVAGQAITNTDLLTSITVSYAGAVVKNYVFGYESSPTTARKRLSSVQECADSSSTNCLIPTTIDYQNGVAGVSTSPTTAVSTASQRPFTHYDLNGDGYPDLVYVSGTTVYVAFGSSSGYGTPVSTGISSVNLGPLGDLLGSGKDGILAKNGTTWYYYTWNGSSFSGVPTGLTYTGANTVLVDTNGDGLPDLITWTTPTTGGTAGLHMSSQLNTSSAGTVSFNPTVNDALDFLCYSNCTTTLWYPDNAGPSPLRSWDFKNDGSQDLAFTTYVNGAYAAYQLLSQGAGFTAYAVPSPLNTNIGAQPPFVADLNNDGCDDVVWGPDIYFSGCDGSQPSHVAIAATPLVVLDWDGDGRADLVVSNGSNLGVYLSTGLGISSTIQSTSVPYTSSCTYFAFDVDGDGLDDLGCWSQSGSQPVSYYLHSGDGTPPDLMSFVVDGYGNFASPTYVSLTQGVNTYTNNTDATYGYQNYIGPLSVVNAVTFSDPSQAPGATYTQTYTYSSAWTNIQGRGFQAFLSRKVSDSRTALIDTQYYERPFPYTGMMYEDDWSNGTVHPNTTQGTPAVITLDSTPNNGRVFPYFSSTTGNVVEVGGPENGDPVRQTVTNYTYDNYGNATNIVTTVTDQDPASSTPTYTGVTWTTNITNSPDVDVPANQAADLAAWCLNMLDETQVAYTSTLSGSSTVTRTKTFTPDTPSACRIKTAVTEPNANGGLYKVIEALTFDSFGNVQSDTVSGNTTAPGNTVPSSPASRLTTLNWGTTGQFLNSRIDPSGATTTWIYSSNQALTFGVPDSVKNANNLTTSWMYDAFGRKSRETRPDGTSTTWAWSACTSFCGWSNSVYQIAQTAYQTNGTSPIRTDTNFYDPMNRVTETSGPLLTGSTGIVQKLYNSLGLLAQQSIPFLSGATAYQQTYGYDILNRLTSVTRPISSTNSSLQSTGYTYAGRTLTIKDPYGNEKTVITDVNGWLRQTKDALGYNVTRSFNSAGSLIGITDSVGNTLLKNVAYNYGIKPFLVAATDADRGAWAYVVDSLGERIGWTDANGHSFSMTYDALSRPLTRTDPITSTDLGLFTQWTWGSAPTSDNVGQLVSECTMTGNPTSCGSTPQYSETRSFDTLGRLSTRSITQAGNGGNNSGGAFLFTLGYSATTGFLNTLTYPISTSGFALTLQYGYQNGLLQSVTDTTDGTSTCGSTCTLWTANAANGFGQATQETLGNGVVTNRTYDPVTSWLSAATAGVGGGATLLNQSYLEDENGNIIQRQNNNLGLTESFAYDADNRLTCTALSSTCTTPTIAYDGGAAGPGNITSQTGVGIYAYPPAGQPRPHAVSSITGTLNGIANPTFSYDANGNMTARASTSANITWSSYNYPTAISATDATGNEEIQLTYGPDRQRWKQVYTIPGTQETTYYVGGLIDVVFNGSTTDYRHYIYAGNEPVAVYSRTAAGVNTMRYMLEDHQTSLSTVTSNAGATDITESFTAFGQRRNPSTWSGTPTAGDLTTIAGISRQGHTFQTWLGQSMGLNHMNGRVEDAILGRFLSPDPHIPDPSNAQTYNRYSYVNNNPVTGTDPTGFICHKCDTGVGFAPGITGPDANGSPDGSYDPSGTNGQPSPSEVPALGSLIFNFGGSSASNSTTNAAGSSFAQLAGDPLATPGSNDGAAAQSPNSTQSQPSGDPATQSPQQSQAPQLAEIAVTANRLPDYVTFQLDLYVFSVSATYTVYGDVFFGKGASRSYPNARFGHVGVSISDGWMLTPNNVAPDPSALNNFLINWSGSVGGYDFVGGSYQFNSAGMSINAGVGFGGFGASPGIINSYQGNIFGNQ